MSAKSFSIAKVVPSKLTDQIAAWSPSEIPETLGIFPEPRRKLSFITGGPESSKLNWVAV